MGDIGSAFAEAARLIFAADGTLYGIVLLSLEVSLTAVAVATAVRITKRVCLRSTKQLAAMTVGKAMSRR